MPYQNGRETILDSCQQGDAYEAGEQDRDLRPQVLGHVEASHDVVAKQPGERRDEQEHRCATGNAKPDQTVHRLRIPVATRMGHPPEQRALDRDLEQVQKSRKRKHYLQGPVARHPEPADDDRDAQERGEHREAAADQDYYAVCHKSLGGFHLQLCVNGVN